MKKKKFPKPKRKAVVINTRWQDAGTCILCGGDTSETLGYCRSCGKGANDA